jgi:hypothetical protein
MQCWVFFDFVSQEELGFGVAGAGALPITRRQSSRVRVIVYCYRDGGKDGMDLPNSGESLGAGSVARLQCRSGLIRVPVCFGVVSGA